MAGQTVATLLDERRAVGDALAQTRAALRQAARRSATAARHWVLPERLRSAAIAMYQLAGAAEPAARYLQACGAERHWPDRAQSELTVLVEDMFLHAGVDDIAALVDAHAPSDPDALAIAHKYVQEWAVAVWARGLNEGRGIAPTNHSLLTEVERHRAQIPEAFRPIGVTCGRRAKRLLFRMRRRWGGRYAAIPVGEEHVGPAEVRAKAPHGIRQITVQWG